MMCKRITMRAMRSLIDLGASADHAVASPVAATSDLATSRWGESVGTCPCCGNRSRVVWGGISSADAIEAIYFVRWTEAPDHAADIDLILGAWGPGARPDARTLVTLRYQARPNGGSLVAIDSSGRLAASPAVCGRALAASELASSEHAESIQSMIAALWMGEPVIGDLNAYNSAL